MGGFRCVAALLGMLALTPLYAEPQAPQTIRVIPKTVISPGASGSIGSSRQVERYNRYAGQRLPADGIHQQQSHYGSQAVQSRGGIRQSIEYPNGYRVQRYPGQSTESFERSR